MTRYLVRISLYTAALFFAHSFGVYIAGGFQGAFFAALVLALVLYWAAELGKRILFSFILKRGSINSLLFYLFRLCGFVMLVTFGLSIATALFPTFVTSTGLLSQVVLSVLLLVASLGANLKVKEKKTIAVGGSRYSKRDIRKRLGS